MPLRPLGAALAAAALVLTACSGTSEPDDPESDAPAVPALDVVWRVPADDAFGDLDDGHGDAWWPGQDTVTRVGRHQVTTHDLSSGEVLAAFGLPGEVCAVSRDLNDRGLGAVVLKTKGECRDVALVDTERHTVRWTADAGAEVYLNDVSIGDRTVATTDAALGARLFRLRDGKQVAEMTGGDGAADGEHVVVTPDGPGKQPYRIYDQATGELLRTVPGGENPRVERVVSSEPLVVASYSGEDETTTLRDLSGQTPRTVGRAIDGSYPHFTDYFTVGDTFAVQYGASPVVDAWDADAVALTRAAVLAPTEAIVGVHDDRLITVGSTQRKIGPQSSLVRAIDPAAPDSSVVLGATGDGDDVALSTDAVVVGDLLVSATGDELVAVRLPAEGVPVAEWWSAEGFGDGALTPPQAGDLCPGVRPATIRRLGVDRPRAGIDAACRLGPIADSTYVYVSSYADAADATTEREATEVAERGFAATVDKSGSNNLAKLRRIDGPGDETAVGRDALLIRVDNATILVQVGGPDPEARPGPARSAILRLGADLVTELEGRR